jgi:hypothetical protein
MYPLLSLNVETTGLWLRVFGYGLSVRIRGSYDPLFSERNGLVPMLDLGPLRFRALSPGSWR